MKTQWRHKGRLIDHIQLVVTDFDASDSFYASVLATMKVPTRL